MPSSLHRATKNSGAGHALQRIRHIHGRREANHLQLVNDLGTFRLETFKTSPHLSKLLVRMPLPLRDLSNHAKRIAGPIRQGRVTWEFLVRQVRVIDDRSRGFDDVYSLRPISNGKFSAPNGSVQSPGAIYPRQNLSFTVVRCVSSSYQIAVLKVRTSSMKELLTKPAIRCRHKWIAPHEMEDGDSLTPNDNHEARPVCCRKPLRTGYTEDRRNKKFHAG